MTAKKTAAQRQGRGTPDVGALVPYSGPVPPCPLREDGNFVAQELRDEWLELWRTPVASSWDPQSDLAALHRLFRLRDQVNRLMVKVFEMGDMVDGSQEQKVLNPLHRLITVLTGQILALEDRFGLSPSARFKLGIEIGGAVKAAQTLEDQNAGFTPEGFE